METALVNYKSYILNETNMQNYLKYKPVDFLNYKNNKSNDNKSNDNKSNVNKSNVNKSNDNKKIDCKTSQLFVPRDPDTLFWCYYIIKNGDIQYEMLQNRNILTEKQEKIGLVTKIRDNKQVVKTYKFDTIANLENNLANDNNLSIKTFMTICSIDNINIIFIRKNTYYELLVNDSNAIYIIREIDKNYMKYSKQYGYELANENELKLIRSNLYKLDTINKPIKSVSSYKVLDLFNIANKLAIEVVNKQTGKNKTKNELYEEIIQYF